MAFAYKAKIVEITDKGNVRMLLSGRLSFAQGLLQAQEYMGNTKYSCDILLEKEKLPPEYLETMKKALNEAVKGGVAHKWNGRKPVALDTPYRNGDTRQQEKPDTYEAYAGCYYISPKRTLNSGPPLVIDRTGNRIERTGEDIDGGDWCAFDVTLYPYSAGSNKGVAVSLNSVRLLEKGDRFSGGPSAESSLKEFDALFGEEMDESVEEDLFDGLG